MRYQALNQVSDQDFWIEEQLEKERQYRRQKRQYQPEIDLPIIQVPLAPKTEQPTEKTQERGVLIIEL